MISLLQLTCSPIKESGISLKNDKPDKPDTSNCLSSKPLDMPPLPAASSNQIKDVPTFEQNRENMRRELQRLIGVRF
jgi:hypothetical protein